MRVENKKIPYVCHQCSNWFYDDDKDFSNCPICNKEILKIKNSNDRHLEQCKHCSNLFETQRKSPYDNAHYLNCDNCVSLLKINYSDSVLQKYSNELGFYTKNINSGEINTYHEEVESHLNNCLCGGKFSFVNNKKCPFCLEEVEEITNNYLIMNDNRKNITIPVLSKHIWLNSIDKLLELKYENEKEFTIFYFLKQGKYLQERFFELKQAFAKDINELLGIENILNLAKVYKFDESKIKLEKEFEFKFEIFENYFNFILENKDKNVQSYLINGKTAKIELVSIE
ncbi:MAG: hypothetical protein AABZ74_15345 [Cyanobacteriota bacterium]